MTEDIKQLFSQHRVDGDRPLGIDSEAIAQGGRKRRRRRTTGLVATAVVLVAVLTAGSVTLPRYLGGSADAATDTGSEQPSHPLPELEPLADDDHYVAGIVPDDEGKRTDAADEYGDAYVEWFADNMGVEFEQWPGVRVFEEKIGYWSDKDKEVIDIGGFWPPRYRIGAVAGGGPDGPSSWFSHSFSGDRYFDELSLTVYPRDSFLPGSGEGAQYLQDCQERQYNDVVTEQTCTDETGPEGERILRAVTEEKNSDDMDSGIMTKTLTVTVFREDGTAVQVGNSVPGVSMEDNMGYGKYETEMDFDDLTDLALSMPDAIVTG